MKSFSKNLSFGVDFKLLVPPLMYKINTHNTSGVRNYVNSLGWRVIMTNYVCMYVIHCIFGIEYIVLSKEKFYILYALHSEKQIRISGRCHILHIIILIGLSNEKGKFDNIAHIHMHKSSSHSFSSDYDLTSHTTYV